MAFHNYQPQFAKGICEKCAKEYKRQGPKQRICRTCRLKAEK